MWRPLQHDYAVAELNRTPAWGLGIVHCPLTSTSLPTGGLRLGNTLMSIDKLTRLPPVFPFPSKLTTAVAITYVSLASLTELCGVYIGLRRADTVQSRDMPMASSIPRKAFLQIVLPNRASPRDTRMFWRVYLSRLRLWKGEWRGW